MKCITIYQIYNSLCYFYQFMNFIPAYKIYTSYWALYQLSFQFLTLKLRKTKRYFSRND